MNLPQTKILLEKIISLYKTVSADEKNISTIERDLMLSYIRQLYEAVSENSVPSSALSANRQASASPPPKPIQPVVTASPKPEPPKVEVQEPVPVRAVPPPSIIAPPPPPPTVVEPPPPVYTAPKAVEHQAYMPPQEQHKPIHVASPSGSAHIPADVAVLFEMNEGKELSDKLSNTPIPDLTKVFGFNDKLLMQNELFGGNKAVFDEAVKDLNGSSSYETANALLVSMASKYHWTATEDRKKHAKAFIKLVRRRFK